MGSAWQLPFHCFHFLKEKKIPKPLRQLGLFKKCIRHYSTSWISVTSMDYCNLHGLLQFPWITGTSRDFCCLHGLLELPGTLTSMDFRSLHGSLYLHGLLLRCSESDPLAEMLSPAELTCEQQTDQTPSFQLYFLLKMCRKVTIAKKKTGKAL